MLSVVPIKSSSVSAGYHLQQDGGYYIEGKENSDLFQWIGKGAARLGLNGQVDITAYQDIFTGKLPNGMRIGKKMPDGSLKCRPGYDLTFSMNKDLSLIICCSKDKLLSDYFMKSHYEAVKTVMLEVERKVQARITVGGVTEYTSTKNLVGAMCTHFSSRAGDPQVHTHVCVANATECGDGKWRALATDMNRKHGFFEIARDHAVYFGSIYQNEMAHAVKQKGFDIERIHKNGLFKIKGMPDEMREHFSKRRTQIKDIVQTFGPDAMENKNLVSQVAQHSKASKVKSDPETFSLKSQQDMKTYIDSSSQYSSFDEVISSCHSIAGMNKQEPINQHAAKQAIQDAIDHQSKFNVVLDGNDILNQAIQFDLGNSDYRAIVSALEDSIERGGLLPTETGRYTTPALIQQEKRLDTLAKQAIGNDSANDKLSENRRGNQLNDLLGTLHQSRICVINEPARLADRDEMLNMVIADLEKEYKNINVLVSSKSLSSHYNENVKKNDTSIWKRLTRLGKGDLACNTHAFLHQYEEKLSLPFNRIFSNKGKDVIIVNGAQSMSHDDVCKLLTLTEQRQKKVIFLKHSEGRRSLFAGNPLDIVERAGANQIEVRAKGSLSENEISSKVKVIEALCDSSKTSKKQAARQRVCADLVANHYVDKLSETLVISQSKASAKKLNTEIRESLINAGKVGKNEKTVMVAEPIFLSPQEQKHAKFYTKNAIIKTHIGRGVFTTQKIMRHDLETNTLIVQNGRGKSSIVTPKSLSQKIKAHEVHLYLEKPLAISIGDQCRMKRMNKQTKLLGFKPDSSYRIIGLSDKQVKFESNIRTEKPLRVKLHKLHATSLDYDYARSMNDVAFTRSKKAVICELSNHAIDKSLLTELSRATDEIKIISNHALKANKKLGLTRYKENAIDQYTVLSKNDLTLSRQAIHYAVNVVSSREAAFTYETLMHQALNFPGATIKQQDLRSELINLINGGDLLYRKAEFGEVVFVTKEAIAKEAEIIRQIKSGKNQISAFLTPEDATLFLESQRDATRTSVNLTRGQEEACKLIATTKDRFVMIQGYAGTGKSTMLETLVGTTKYQKPGLHQPLQSMLPSNTNILALAPTHQAVHELKEKGIEAQTLKSFLVDQKSLNHDSKNTSQLNNTLIILDESSMVSNTDFAELQHAVEKNNARCAYIGDIAQLSAVEAGKPSELAYISKEANISIAVMDDHVRQTNQELWGIAGLLMKGGNNNFSTAIDKLNNLGAINEHLKDGPAAIKSLARRYASLIEQDKETTLVAVATNRDREELNEAIRTELKNNGELLGKAISSTKLIDSRLTPQELQYAEHYKVGMVVKYKEYYHQVVDCSIERNTITMLDEKNNRQILSLSHLPKNAYIELYDQKKVEYAEGDRIKFTKTDRDRGWFANTQLTVESVNPHNQLLIALDKEGQIFNIPANETGSQHLDYGYCSTVHGLQGATSKGILTYLNSKNIKSNTMKMLYVLVTRAKESVGIYTDNLSKIKQQIITNEGEKVSALESLGLLDLKPKDTHRAKVSVALSEVNQGHNRLDGKAIEQRLRQRPDVIIENLFGKPNQKLSTESNWRYGTKGSLSIMMRGEHTGQFTNFETGEKGGMISLIMSEYGVNFKDALEIANRILGNSKADIMVKSKNHLVKNLLVDESKPLDVKKERIKKIIDKSKPIEGTIAEKYLNNRGILDIKNTSLRFLDHVKTGAGNTQIKPFSAALLSISKNEYGAAQAVQLTYLDKNTGAKLSDLEIPKRTMGSMKDAYVDLTPRIKSPDITFVSEGVETGLSIRDAARKMNNVQVIATLGKQNMANISMKNTADRIVLVLDNDLKNPLEDRVIQDAVKSLEIQNKQVEYLYPDAINGQKTDYNDVAQARQYSSIERDLLSVSETKLQSKDDLDTKSQLNKEVELEI